MVNHSEPKLKIPTWMGSRLNEDSVALIENAVSEAETQTVGEIVPMIIRRASEGFHPTLLLVISYSFLFFVCYEISHRDAWSAWSEILTVSCFILGLLVVYWFSKTSAARLMFLNQDDLTSLVEQRAAVEFISADVGRTFGRTGILLMVSIEDRRAVVLGDSAIAQKVTQQDWDQALSCILVGIKSKDLGKGMSEAVRQCGKILATHFPVNTSRNPDELSNRLLFRD